MAQRRRSSGRSNGWLDVMFASLGLLVLALPILSLVGCGGEEATRPTAPVVEPPEVAEGPEAGAPPLEARDLAPVIREVAPAGVGPQKVTIEFARQVVDESAVGKAPAEGTDLRIEPPIDGQWTYTSPSTLTFEPSAGFPPGRRFEVELLALATRDGVLSAPQDGRWLRVLDVPELSFVRFALDSVDFAKKRMGVQLTFSGPVEPIEVSRRATLTVQSPGERSRIDPKARFERGSSPNTVIASFSGQAVRAGARVELRLEAGVPSHLDEQQRAGGTRASVQLEMGKMARVLHSYAHEGTNGYYVQVICDDSSIEARRYHWDRQTYNSYNLSTRCVLDEADAAAGIRFEPPVDFSIAPAGGGFRIFGNFERGSYQMRIDAGVRTADGGMVHQTYEKELTVSARKPRISFASKGRYLPRSAWRSLPVRHLNVSGATVLVRHVPPENLVFWMSDESEDTGARTSNLIAKQKVDLRGQPDHEATTHVDLGSLVSSQTKGLLEIEMISGNARDSARILLTDLHLVAKRLGPEDGRGDAQRRRAVHAWAVSMDTVEPLRGVDIQLVRPSGFAVASCRTGGDGGCRLDPPDEGLDPALPFALIARRGDDLTYLKFDELEAEVQEARVAGEPYRGEKAYRAAIYSERGVYRPGETAHLAAIVRQRDNIAPPADMPVEAKILDPQGQVIRQVQLATNAAGYVDLDLDFPAFASTGRYEAQLAAGGNTIGQYPFQVEEFVPERMKVEVGSRESDYQLAESMELDIAARYLFGGVPSGHKVELRCELLPGNFSPKENNNYHYGVWQSEDTPTRPLDLGTLTTELDAEGRGTYACPGRAGLGRGPSFRGPARLLARAAVFEAGSGRTTVGQASVPVHPDSFYIGLQTGTTKVERGSEVVVEGIAVDWQGQTVRDVSQVELSFIRLDTEYGWYYDEQRGYETYRRFLRPVTESTQEVSLEGGKFTATWNPAGDGAAFLVRASAGDARTELHLEGTGDWYWWRPEESDVERTPRPGRPTWLALDTPDSIRVGERFPINFEVPWDGRVLLTTETDEVLHSQWIDAPAGEAVFFLELEDFVPNVYVTAFLVKDPYLDSPTAFLPDRAFGVSSVRVEPRQFTHQLALDTPEEVRSSSELRVALDLGDSRGDGPTYATVAAVDEGILSLTRFESPDPFEQIFTRRALGVETFETVGWTLLVPPGGPASATGGDGAGDLGRVQPVKPVALWSGVVEVPPNGKLEVGFDVPQYRGELRVMAVTAGRERMGRAEASVTVRDPLVVQSTLPRFLAQDDEIDIPVMVTNVSGTERTVDIELTAEALAVLGLETADDSPPVELLGPTTAQLELAHGEAGQAVFRARALAPTGAAHLEVRVTSGDLESVESTDVPLLPTGPKRRIVQRIELQEGENDIAQHLDGWLPLSERSTFWVTNNPYGDTFGHLEYLVRYPYGCIEQTVSSTRPLLYLGSLVDRVAPALVADTTLEEMVQSGIDRLFSMQTPSGGFAYWPGGIRPAFWGTANATHMLLDARDLGYPVSAQRLGDALDWMERQISNYYEAGQDEWYGRGAEAYMHIVLAREGRGRKARIENRLAVLSKSTKRWEQERAFMLKAALYLAGDHRWEQDLRQPDVTPISDRRRNGWSFWSDRRTRGFMLSTYVDLFGRDEGARPLADLVARALQGPSPRYTTQELVWGITGLGKFIESGTASFDPPELRLALDGGSARRITPKTTGEETSDRVWEVARASEYAEVELRVPSKDEGKLFLILASEGVRENPDWKTGGEGLRLSRRWLDALGQPIDLSANIDLGQLIYVELSLSNTSPERVANLALVDRVPAGWEIENPRLGRGGGTEWIDTDRQWQADHMNVRDDRLEVFGHLQSGESRQIIYAVRAVTAGDFAIPPVEMEAMYDPRLWAREDGRRVTVRGPWQSPTQTARTTQPTAAHAASTGAAAGMD